MKPKMRTGEWLAEARRQAGLSQPELAELAGLKSTMLISNFETGVRVPPSQTWERLEEALRPLAPLMFVFEEDLLNDARAGMRWEQEGASCRLTYVLGKYGFVFTRVASVREDLPEDSFIVVSFADAVKLLEEQMAGFKSVAAPKEAEEGEGAQLAKMRRELGLSQRAVAAMLSSKQPSISLLERGVAEDPGLAKCYRALLEKIKQEESASEGEGAQLRKMRKSLGLGQLEVASMLSADQGNISRLERGHTQLPDLTRRYRELMEQLSAKA